MNSPVVAFGRKTNRRALAQHADQSFPYVLVLGTAGTILVLGSIWLTALALA
jgi:hypothetical protein